MSDRKDPIDLELSKINTVLNYLKGSEAWGIVIEDCISYAKELDNRWCYIVKPEEMQEARVTKMALMHVMNLLDRYELNKQNLEKEKVSMDNIKDFIPRDMDIE